MFTLLWRSISARKGRLWPIRIVQSTTRLVDIYCIVEYDLDTENEIIQLKLDLAKFQKLSASDPAFKTTLGVLYKDLQGHIAEEEQHDLPKLESAIKNDTEKMAASFERTKTFVPTRSHPSAPDKPPFETVVGLMTAPIDKLMDIFQKFPTSEEKEKVLNK